MRTPRPLPKTLEEVDIPDDLRAFLRDVHSAVERRDEETLIESDDLLQADTVYGGLIEEGGSLFGFTYFPEHAEEGIRHKWELELEPEAIAAIAAGTRSRLSLWACGGENCLSKFQKEDDLCFYDDYVETEGEGAV